MDGAARPEAQIETASGHPAASIRSPRQRHRLSPHQRLRRWLFVNLDPRAWRRPGLSPLNQTIFASIVVTVTLAVLETEPSIISKYEHVFAAAEWVMGTLFSIEYAARFWVADYDRRYGTGWPARIRYALTPAALVDLIAILVSFATPTGLQPFLLRAFRLMRILRLARLGRMTTAVGYLTDAIRARRFELFFSLFVGLSFLVFSATLLYLVEGRVQPEKFGSIPRAMWWAVATLTTIGYGDVYPITPLGKLLAGVTAIAGIGLVAMPTGIMAAAFSEAVQKHSSTVESEQEEAHRRAKERKAKLKRARAARR